MKIKQGRAKGLFGNKGAEGRLGSVPKYINEILKKKKKVRVLEVGTGYARALLELKGIFGNKVAISNWTEKEPIVVVIENKHVHDLYKQQFELLWKS